MPKLPRAGTYKGDAPTGDWEMAAPPLVNALGHFVLGWSLVEATIEVSIAKQLQLSPLEGSMVTAGLLFHARVNLLLSLLERSTSGNEEAIRIVKTMQSMQDRNDMLHGVIGGTENAVWFNRRRTQQRFTSKIETYDTKRLLGAAARCSELATDLMKTLGITRADYLSFFQDSHNSANRE